MVIKYLHICNENELGKLSTKNDLVVIALRNTCIYHYYIYLYFCLIQQVALMETFNKVLSMKKP